MLNLASVVKERTRHKGARRTGPRRTGPRLASIERSPGASLPSSLYFPGSHVVALARVLCRSSLAPSQ